MSETLLKISHMCFRRARKLKSRKLPLKKPREQPNGQKPFKTNSHMCVRAARKLKSRKLPLKRPREQPNNQKPFSKSAICASGGRGSEKAVSFHSKAAGAAKWSETILKISHMCFRGARKLKSRKLPLKKPREQPNGLKPL